MTQSVAGLAVIHENKITGGDKIGWARDVVGKLMRSLRRLNGDKQRVEGARGEEVFAWLAVKKPARDRWVGHVAAVHVTEGAEGALVATRRSEVACGKHGDGARWWRGVKGRGLEDRWGRRSVHVANRRGVRGKCDVCGCAWREMHMAEVTTWRGRRTVLERDRRGYSGPTGFSVTGCAAGSGAK